MMSILYAIRFYVPQEAEMDLWVPCNPHVQLHRAFVTFPLSFKTYNVHPGDRETEVMVACIVSS